MLEKLQNMFKTQLKAEPSKRLKPSKSSKIAPPTAANLAPVVVLACGAGMAFWWWSQWARSREEALAAEEKAAAPMGEVVDIVDPQALEALDESLAVQADAANAEAPSAAA